MGFVYQRSYKDTILITAGGQDDHNAEINLLWSSIVSAVSMEFDWKMYLGFLFN